MVAVKPKHVAAN